jgi:integrase
MASYCTDSVPPRKPYPTFPLYAHRNDQWAKKVKGETRFFGVWADPDAALANYHRHGSGRVLVHGLMVGDMVNLCLGVKKTLLEAGELKGRTYEEYKIIGERVIRVLGRSTSVESLEPIDFLRLRQDFQKTHRSPVSLKGDIRKTKVFFNFALEEGYVERVIRYGQGFKVPSASVLRKAKKPRMFTPEQIRQLLPAANKTLRAMILLGINCGFGNNDCATLKWSAIHGGWVTHARPKTGIVRRVPLWSETLTAFETVKKHGQVVFITKFGRTFEQSSISKEFRKLCQKAGITGPNFYALRHTFATVALKTKDKDAVRAIMGHVAAANDMLAVYDEERVSDERLTAVTNYVHSWLYD